MKKCVFALTFAVLLSAAAFAQEKADLSGTWEGKSFAEGPNLDLTLVMNLEQTTAGLKGHVKDDVGYIDSDLKDLKFEKGVFTCTATAVTPGGSVPMHFTMKVTENKMEGDWKADDGVTGKWKAERYIPKLEDLAGTWKGYAMTPDAKDNIVMTLTVKNGKVTGKTSDDLGYLSDSPVTEVKLEKNKITILTKVYLDTGENTLSLAGKMTKGTIEGYWEIVGSGDSDTFKLTKQK